MEGTVPWRVRNNQSNIKPQPGQKGTPGSQPPGPPKGATKQRLSKDEKTGIVMERLLEVAHRFESQLHSLGYQTGVWKRTAEEAQRCVQRLLVTGGNYPEEGIPRTDDERIKFMGTNLVPINVPTTTTTTRTTTDSGRAASPVVGLSTEGVAFEFPEPDFGNDIGYFDDSHLLGKSSGPASDANPSEERDVVLYKGKSLATTIELDKGDDEESDGGWSHPAFSFDMLQEEAKRNDQGNARTSGGESSAQASKINVGSTLVGKSRSDLPCDQESKRRRIEAVPARKELVDFTKTMDDQRPRKWDHKRFQFVNPRPPFGVCLTDSNPNNYRRDPNNFDQLQLEMGKFAMHVLCNRNRFTEDPIAPNIWAHNWEKESKLWEKEHFGRWGDRDFWPFHPGLSDGHMFPRILAHRKCLESLEVVYRTDIGTEIVKPFSVPPVRSYPIAYDPVVRISVFNEEDSTIRVVSPYGDDELSRRFLDDVKAEAFTRFASYQTDLHPVRAAMLDRHHNLGEVLACLYRFLYAYNVKFSSDEGVLLRQDARLVWSQTSEAWAGRFKPPTLIFRIGKFHFGWWHCQWLATKKLFNIEGTDKIYNIESDRWMGMWFVGSDFTDYYPNQRWDSGRKN
jgi:hypothetical protein